VGLEYGFPYPDLIICGSKPDYPDPDSARQRRERAAARRELERGERVVARERERERRERVTLISPRLVPMARYESSLVHCKAHTISTP